MGHWYFVICHYARADNKAIGKYLFDTVIEGGDSHAAGQHPWPPAVRNLPMTEFSSRRISRRPDGPPCCFVLMPSCANHSGIQQVLGVPPKRTGNCARSRRQ